MHTGTNDLPKQLLPRQWFRPGPTTSILHTKWPSGFNRLVPLKMRRCWLHLRRCSVQGYLGIGKIAVLKPLKPFYPSGFKIETPLITLVQWNYECFCGNSFGKHGRMPNGDCSFSCQDTSGINKCGGSSRNNVYLSTGLI